MSAIPYQKEDPLSINVAFKCRKRGFFTAFMACPECRHFPCSQLDAADVRILHVSPLMERIFKHFEQRRITPVHILKKFDGSLTLVENLDEKNPSPEMLRDVEEVYVISKVLVPVMTLKPKPMEKIGAEAEAETTEPPSAPDKADAAKKRKEK